MAVDHGGTSLSVHRCRFVDFQPAAITALAFTPLPLPRVQQSVKGKQKAEGSRWGTGYKFGTLVVGRANGDIELCEWTGEQEGFNSKPESSQAWVPRKTLPGPYPSKVDSLALSIRYPEHFGPEDVPKTSDLRLFSTGGGSEVLEWDMNTARVKNTLSSQGGSVWCMAVNPASTMLALGCEDGAVRLVSLVHDSLEHHRRFDRVKTRILSIAWGPPVPPKPKAEKERETEVGDNNSSSDDEDDVDWTDSWLVTGGSDSSLRKWDFTTGRAIERLNTDRLKGEKTLVWTVGTLGNGTIISGDSMGLVKFWDSHTCTQLHSFRGHGADVLCMAISPDENSVYTSGVDQKIVQFSRVKSVGSASTSTLLRSIKGSHWVQTVARRLHSHDVRALAIWPPHTPMPPSFSSQASFPQTVSPILASGGLDMNLTLTPAAPPVTFKVLNPLLTSLVTTFEEAYQRRVAYRARCVAVARQARLVMCVGDTGLSVWRIPRKAKAADNFLDSTGDLPDSISSAENWEKVLEMDLNFATNVLAGALSDDGMWLVISDLYESKLFKLTNHAPKRVKSFTSLLQRHFPSSLVPTTGASACIFTPDSSKLALSTAIGSYVLIVDLGAEIKVLRRFEQHRTKDVQIGGLTRTLQGADVEANVDADMADGESDFTRPAAGDDPRDTARDGQSSTVVKMTVSTDGQWLATTDERCRTHIFNLDSLQHHTVLPSFPQPIQAMAFDPTPQHRNILVVVLANHGLHLFDVETRQFPDWSRYLCASLPKRFTGLHDAILGMSFSPAPRDATSLVHDVFLWGSTWICKVRLDKPPQEWDGFSRKRRRGRHARHDPNSKITVSTEGDDSSGTNFKLVYHYRPLLCMDFLGSGELVVVERPLVDVMVHLPPAYYESRYGRS